MANEDENKEELLTEFDYGGQPAGAEQANIPPGYAREDVFNLDEPLEFAEQERDLAAQSAFSSTYALLSEEHPKASHGELQNRALAALSGRKYNEGLLPETEFGDERFVVGDPLDSNLIFAPSVGQLISRSGSLGTIPMYKMQEEASAKAMKGMRFDQQVRHILFADPSPETMMTLQQAVDQRLVDKDANLIRPPSVSEREYLPDNETLRTVANYVTGAGAVLGAVGGASSGPAGIVAGSLLGGMVGAGIGNIGVIGVAGFSSMPEDYGVLEGAQDLVKRTYTLIGLPDDLAGFLATSSPEARDLMVTNIVTLAEGLGIERSTQWVKDNEIKELKDISNKGSKSIKAIEKKLSEESPLESAVDSYASIIPILGEGTIRKVVEDIGDDFMLGLYEIVDEIGRNDEYKSMRSQERKNLMVSRKVEYDLLSRKAKPTDEDWAGLNLFNHVEDGIAKEEDIKPQVSGWVDNLSFNTLHPSLRGEVPDVQKFKSLASTIPRNHPMFTKDIPPNIAAAILAVHDGRSDDQIQILVNALPLGFLRHSPGFDSVIENSVPDFEKVKEWAVDTNTFLDDKTGAKMTRIFEREAFDLTNVPVFTDGHTTLYKRSKNAEIMNWAASIVTALNEAEFDLVPEVLEPLAKNFGLPNDLYIPNSAGLDRQNQIGIRDPNLPYLVKLDARIKSGTGGPHLGNQEIARALGYNPDTWAYNFLSATGFVLENLNWEKSILSGAGRFARTVGNVPYAYTGFRAAESGFKFKAAKQNLLSNVSKDASIDPVAAKHQLIEEMLLSQMNKGVNPLQKYDPETGVGISTAQKTLITRLFEEAGIDPEVVFAAFQEAAGNAIKVTKATEDLVRRLGDNQVMVFKSSDSYRRIHSQLNEMVNEGLISPNDAAVFLAQIETQSFKAANSPHTRFFSATEVIDDLEIRLDRSSDDAEGNVRLSLAGTGEDTRFTSRDGILRSAFEYDENTGKRVISLFTRGDMGDLWSSNADFMNSLMGREFSQKLIAMFDHEVDENGVRRLTASGAQQIGDSWQYYRRVKDLPNGFTVRMFDELWISLHNFWSRLRKQQGVLPKQVRQFWDAEFGELPKDRRFVEGAVDSLRRKDSDPIFVSGDELTRAEQARPKKVGQEIVARQMGMDVSTLRSFLGQKVLTRVEVRTDPKTGEQARIPRQVYADFYYDPLDVGRKMLALINVQPYRKRISEARTSTIGTGKYYVPTFRLRIVLEAAKRRMTDALGSLPNELESRIQQRDFQSSDKGYTTLYDQADVTDADISAFANRIRMQAKFPLHSKFEEKLQDLIRTTEFIVLSARERAGLKTLLQELAANPVGDPIPTALLDPNANLRIFSVAEYNRVLEVAQDVEANPLNRIDRNSVHPGYVQSFVNSLKNRNITALVGIGLDKISKVIIKDAPKLNRKNADPALVNKWDQFLRTLAAAPEEIARAAESGKDADFFDFYKRMVSSFAPRVKFANLKFLFDIVSELEGTKASLDADAVAAIRQAEIEGRPPPTGFGSFEAMDIAYIYRNLGRIQDLLDGFYGMTRAERIAITSLRDLFERKSGLTDAMSDADAAIAADALQVLHIGLADKKAVVTNFSRQSLRRAVGYTEPELPIKLTDKEIRSLYVSFYTGNIVKIKDIATNYGFDGLWQARFAFLFGKRGTKIARLFGDTEAMLTNVLIYMKVDEIRYGFARELAELGYDSSRRSLTKEIKPGDSPAIDRQKFLDRVAEFINDELQFQEKMVIGGGEVKKGAPKPKAEAYGSLDSPYLEHPDTGPISQMDRDARAEAASIVDSMGLRRELGQFVPVIIGDRQWLLPETMIDGLNDAINLTYKMPSTFQTLFRNFGRKGTVEYRLNPENIVPIETQKLLDTLTMAKKATELIASPRHFYRRLLIGTGGVPMVPYMASLFIGGLSEIHLGQGAKAVVDNMAGAAKTPVMLALNKLSGERVDFVSGVVARLFGDGSSKPNTRPLVLADGRIFTADMIAQGMDAYGFKTSFAEMTVNPDVHNRILERFTKANPKATAAKIGGALGGMLGALGGPLAAAKGTTTGAGAGLTLGWLLTPNNAFDKTHRFYREVALAIDSYQRVKVFVKELESGLDIPAAAKRTLDTKLDYGNLTDAEAGYFRLAFAFWTYFAQANGLFARSILENPDRVIAQLKLARSSQMAISKGEDPDLVLAPWDRSRIFIPFEIGGHAVRLPYTSVADTVQLLIDFVGFAGLGFGPEETETARMAVVGRLNPYLIEGFKQTYKIDPSRGYDLERATMQVPAALIQLDYDILGGSLWDFLDIKFITHEELKKGWGVDENTGTRFNPNNLEMPTRGIYVAQNTKNYSLFMGLMQTPLSGRMGRLYEAFDRSNLGLTESAGKAADVYFQLDQERPLLARVPGLTRIGLVKAKRPAAIGYSLIGGEKTKQIRRPSASSFGGLDTSTGRRSMREYEKYVEPDGTSYILPYDDFYPLELLKIFGMSPVAVRSFTNNANRKLRANTVEIDESTQ